MKWLNSVEQDSALIIQINDEGDKEKRLFSTGVNFIVANVGSFIQERSSSHLFYAFSIDF